MVKAIIAPHAGFAYSGPTAGWAYAYLLKQQQKPTRIFLIGPSHKKSFKGCSLSGMSVLETPLGNLKVDTDRNYCQYEVIKELEGKADFVKLSKK